MGAAEGSTVGKERVALAAVAKGVPAVASEAI